MRNLSFLTAALCGAVFLLTQGCAPTCESVCARQQVECADILGDTCVDECAPAVEEARSAGCGDLVDTLLACVNGSPNICMPSCDAQAQAVAECAGGGDRTMPPVGTVDSGLGTVDSGLGSFDAGLGDFDAGF